jgi:hypothetical protein
VINGNTLSPAPKLLNMTRVSLTGNHMIKLARIYILLISLIYAGFVFAETGVSRNWIWNTDGKDFYFAITTNSTEHILGQYCYIAEATCFYIVSLDIACEPGSSYPALVNSDMGADHIVLKCVHGYKGRNILAIYEFNKTDELVRAASHLGIAVPVENEQFEVIRFSLIGSSDAIDHMRNAAKKAIDANPAPEKKSVPAEEAI